MTLYTTHTPVEPANLVTHNKEKYQKKEKRKKENVQKRKKCLQKNVERRLILYV